MGTPKALMMAGAEPWWSHQQRRAERIGIRTLWVVSEAVRAAMTDATPTLVVADPRAPMFASLHAGIAAVRADPFDGMFVLPVDVPVPTPPVFAALAGRWASAVPVFRGRRGHPAWLSRDSALALLLADPASSRLDDVLRHGAREVGVDDPDVAVNLNTPDDLAAWRHAVR